ncbi:MAG TPA: ABC transporter ATP-binding protein [Roseiarcus sp.]|jgi:branched-chain amino acid transport system ATP-binding protein
MLEVHNLTVRYGAVEALRNVSVKVPDSGFVAILGANGAGKSTLLRTISGLVRPASGMVTLRGKSITGLKPEAIVRLGLSHVPEGRGIFPDLTVAENLTVGAYVHRSDHASRYASVLANFPALARRERQPGYTLSGGEQQMLAIGRALMSGPSILTADELSLGLAPVVVKQVFETLSEARRAGVTVLVVEQNARLALRFADYLYVLKQGRVVLEGVRDELGRSAELVDAYLGA